MINNHTRIVPDETDITYKQTFGNDQEDVPIVRTKVAFQIQNKKTIHIENEKEEQINSFFELTVMMTCIFLGGLNVGYAISFFTGCVTTVFSIITLKGSYTDELSLFGGIVPIGSLVGAILTYFLMIHTTRRTSILVADLFGISSILMVVADRDCMLTFRFMLGVANGICTIIQPIFVKELCPDKYFSSFIIFNGFAVGTGVLIGDLASLGFLNSGLTQWWRAVFAFPAILCVIRQIIMFILPIESPISLIEFGREDEAKKILQRLYQEQSIEQALSKCKLRVEHNQTQKEGLLSVFSAKHRTTVIIGIMLMFGYTWCGVPAVFTYSAQLFSDMANGDLVMITVYSIIVGFCQQSPAYVSGIVYGRFGKRPILLVGTLAILICLILIAIFNWINSQIALFIIICFCSFFYALTIGPIAWSMTSEINHSEGTYIGMISVWAWQISLFYIFPYMKDGIGLSGSFIVFACITLACLIYYFFTVKETKDLNHTQVEELYGKQ